MKSLECLTVRCLCGIYWLMGLVPLPPCSQRFRLLFSLFIRGIWSAYFLLMLLTGVSFLWRDARLSISYVSGTALFIGYSLLGLLLLLESALKYRSYARLESLRFQSELQIQRLGMSRGCRRAGRLLLLLATQLACDMAKFWANSIAWVSPVLTRTLPHMWLLRFRYVQLLEQVMEMNQRAVQLRHSVVGLANGNDIWQPFGLHEDMQLHTLRLTYDRIFECYETFSDCYGWGMLGLQVMCGFEFVSNAYWIITEAYGARQLYLFVYNGATCFAMGSLITALFCYGDASIENLLSTSRQLFHFVLCFFGVRWSISFHRLQLLTLCCWFCFYPWIWTHTATRSPIFKECALDCLITHTMFLLVTTAHVIVLLDTFVQRRNHQTLWTIETNHFDHHRSVALSFCGVLLLSIAMRILASFCRMCLDNQGTMSLYWIGVPSTTGLQLRLFAFLYDILVANVRVVSLRESLKLLARQQAIHVRQPPDVDSVIQLKLRYSQLSHMFAVINLSYGNSLLTIFIALFLSFVFNSYWLVKNLLLKPDSLVTLLFHLGVITNMGMLLSVICWHCQQSFNHSRQIGCLVSKLIKPLGCKRYNDLVCEFLLQTLHQRFVLTAKDFFNLNLHLLSSMSAAIVTYLVILIQFMFAEKGSRDTVDTEMSPELNKLE